MLASPAAAPALNNRTNGASSAPAPRHRLLKFPILQPRGPLLGSARRRNRERLDDRVEDVQARVEALGGCRVDLRDAPGEVLVQPLDERVVIEVSGIVC